MSGSGSHFPSLLDPADAAAMVSPRARAKVRFRLQIPAWIKRHWSEINSDPSRRQRFNRHAMIVGAVLLVGGGIGAYFALRPVPQPDYLNDGLDDVFNFTLLTDEFNRLPVEKRLELIGQLVSRLKDMKPGDSVMMAGFAAGIAGAARDQIEKNAARLAVDVWDKSAAEYAFVPEESRGEFLEKAAVEYMKMMEAVGGRISEKSDQERLDEIKRQTKRDMETMSNPGRRPDGEDLGRIFGFVHNRVGSHATPAQRARGSQMLRDMTRHFRGQDIATGKPKGGG